MFATTVSTALHLGLLIFFIAVPIYSLTLPSRNQLPLSAASPQPLVRRQQNGNPDAAGDLYGLGLRVGAYMQVFGMILSCIRDHRRSRIGVKLLSASVCVALLTALTVLIARRTISPCEAWLVLSLINVYGIPRFAAVNESPKNHGGVAVLLCLISVVWQELLHLWFFATLYRSLPRLGTSNQVWFFASVDITGWFRIFMPVYSCASCLLLPLDVVGYISMASRKFFAWAEVAEGGQGDESEKAE